MDLGLKGRRALVTGASKGLGKAVAAALSAEGAAVAICARDPNRTQAAAREIGAVGILADLSVVNGVEPLLRQAIERLGGIDILVVNTGGPLDWRRAMSKGVPSNETGHADGLPNGTTCLL